MELGTLSWTACYIKRKWLLPTNQIITGCDGYSEYFWKTQKFRKAELKDFKDILSPPHSGFLMCNRCCHILVQLMFLVLEGTKPVGCRALFYLPMLLLFEDITVDFGWCCGYVRIWCWLQNNRQALLWAETSIALPVQLRLPFCSVPPQAASAAFSGLITDKAQLFDMYQLRVQQKPRPKSQITRGRRMPPYQPVSYQVPIGS